MLGFYSEQLRFEMERRNGNMSAGFNLKWLLYRIRIDEYVLENVRWRYIRESFLPVPLINNVA